MFTIYLRSSSISTWKQCPLKYFISYVLGIRLPANEAANRGTIVHASAERLSRKKMMLQAGTTSYFDDDLNREVLLSEINLDWAVNTAFEYYTVTKPLQQKPFKKDAFQDVHSQVERILNDPIYSPMVNHIIDVEKFFDIELKEDWAKYDFTVQGKRFEGHLKLRGTMDCIMKTNNTHFTYFDIKSGRTRWDWAKQKEKTYDEFRNDVQLRLYHYILNILYPEVDYWTLTLYYSKVGEATAILFTKEDLPYTLKAIRRVFEDIISTKIVKWIKNDSSLNHQCNFCEFAKNTKPGSKDSYCWHYNGSLKKKGLDKIQESDMILESLTKYSGGGSLREIGE